VPIRRDLIYRLADWRMKLDTFSTKKALTKGDVSGSGKKPMAQKETGRARVGNKRAPGRKRGGKAHGPKPVVYSYILNSKIKLQALKSLLTCKLAEGRVRIVTNFTA
jgi:large subunit ribosomal protein L4